MAPLSSATKTQLLSLVIHGEEYLGDDEAEMDFYVAEWNRWNVTTPTLLPQNAQGGDDHPLDHDELTTTSPSKPYSPTIRPTTPQHGQRPWYYEYGREWREEFLLNQCSQVPFPPSSQQKTSSSPRRHSTGLPTTVVDEDSIITSSPPTGHCGYHGEATRQYDLLAHPEHDTSLNSPQAINYASTFQAQVVQTTLPNLQKDADNDFPSSEATTQSMTDEPDQLLTPTAHTAAVSSTARKRERSPTKEIKDEDVNEDDGSFRKGFCSEYGDCDLDDIEGRVQTPRKRRRI